MKSSIATRIGILILAIALPAVAQDSRSKKTPPDKAKAAYKQMRSAQTALAANAQRIAQGAVPIKDSLGLIARMCKQQCEVQEANCIMYQAAPNLSIGFPERAPKEWPIDIPECNDPDCQSSSKSGPPRLDCSKVKAACDKKCDCIGV